MTRQYKGFARNWESFCNMRAENVVKLSSNAQRGSYRGLIKHQFGADHPLLAAGEPQEQMKLGVIWNGAG